MKKLFKQGLPKKLRFALCIAIIPLSSPLAVQGIISLMPLPNDAAMPLVITFLTLAYAWCIWEIWENPGFKNSSEETLHKDEIDWQPSKQM